MKRPTTGTLRPGTVSTRLCQIAEVSRRRRGEVLTSLAHHIDLVWLHEAYRRTRKSGAAGVDGVRAEEYARDLDRNLLDLLEGFKTGRYKAPPVRRVEIPKGDGRTRPLGIPTFEDKALQRAVAMVLEAVYEEEFLDFSYGFRRGRSAHDAIEALREGLMEMHGGWVIDLDIERFFDTLDHRELRRMLDTRVRDGVLRRQIDKWLNAGVLTEGRYERPVSGTPQGGVISPLLANVYLHEVLDKWFVEKVEPRMRERAFMVRYADDVVLAFRSRNDAERVMRVLPKRLARYGLSLHRDKTRLVKFARPPKGSRPGTGDRPGTFDFLGFTHYWAKSRKGNWAIKRKTSSKRLRRALSTIAQWCQANRHLPIPKQQRFLTTVMKGHYWYYGITGNNDSLGRFLRAVHRAWHKWLSRRSQKRMTWAKYLELLKRHPLPKPVSYRSTLRRCRPGVANPLF